MKKLIRSTTTRAFLTPNGGWTNEIKGAREFSDYAEAATLRLQLLLKDVEMYYAFSEEASSQSDFTLPLN